MMMCKLFSNLLDLANVVALGLIVEDLDYWEV